MQWKFKKRGSIEAELAVVQLRCHVDTDGRLGHG
jgi:hypothetical protein